MKNLDYLKVAAERGSKLGLERITELCRRLGEPQNKVKIIHIAGTNGKGSFGALISAVLADSGYVAGSFSSPALTEINDSFRINGEVLPLDELDDILGEVVPVCEDMDDKPTEFEVLTAAAYLMFVRKNCDIAVVECGMGGDTDSTNVAESPVLSVITNVAVDHTAFLGSAIQEIAAHKAGIIKNGCPVLYGGNDRDALAVIQSRAESLDAPLYITDHNRIHAVNSDISGVELVDSAFGRLTTRLIGSYQKYNIANVLTAVEILRKSGLNIPENAVISGISRTVWHGRFEVVSREPLIIFDGAHNPDGIIQAAAAIRQYFSGKIALLIGVMADKEYSLYPELLGKFIDRAFTVTPDNPRALDSSVLAAEFERYGISAVSCDDVASGTKKAADHAISRNIPLIALGSLYMYKDFIKSLYSQST